MFSLGTGKDSPGESGDSSVVIGSGHSGEIDGVIGDGRTARQLHFKRRKVSGRTQKLNVRLLIHISDEQVETLSFFFSSGALTLLQVPIRARDDARAVR